MDKILNLSRVEKECKKSITKEVEVEKLVIREGIVTDRIRSITIESTQRSEVIHQIHLEDIINSISRDGGATIIIGRDINHTIREKKIRIGTKETEISSFRGFRRINHRRNSTKWKIRDKILGQRVEITDNN